MAIIPFETTKVPADKSAAEMETMLRRANVQKTGKVYESDRIKAIYFQMETAEGSMPFKLPVNTRAVYQMMLNKKKGMSIYRYNRVPNEMLQKMEHQAERTAWRIIHWWLKSQLALIAMDMTTGTEAFLPYLLVGSEETLYERLQADGFKALGPGVGVS